MYKGSLQQHLREDHEQGRADRYIKEIVFGGTDGIVTTFAVVAGFAGAGEKSTTLPLLTVLLFGFANLFADGVSMALGDFLSSRSESEYYLKQREKEKKEIAHHPEAEVRETQDILRTRGFTKEQAEKIAELYATNPEYWLSFMMNDELELPDPEPKTITLRSLITFFSFLGFGIIPLLPYILLPKAGDTFLLSTLATGIALMLLGYSRYLITKRSILSSIVESLLLGGAAASVAFVVGKLFQGRL